MSAAYSLAVFVAALVLFIAAVLAEGPIAARRRAQGAAVLLVVWTVGLLVQDLVQDLVQAVAP